MRKIEDGDSARRRENDKRHEFFGVGAAAELNRLEVDADDALRLRVEVVAQIFDDVARGAQRVDEVDAMQILLAEWKKNVVVVG